MCARHRRRAGNEQRDENKVRHRGVCDGENGANGGLGSRGHDARRDETSNVRLEKRAYAFNDGHFPEPSVAEASEIENGGPARRLQGIWLTVCYFLEAGVSGRKREELIPGDATGERPIVDCFLWMGAASAGRGQLGDIAVFVRVSLVRGLHLGVLRFKGLEKFICNLPQKLTR